MASVTTVLNRLADVPLALGRDLHLVQQDTVMKPGQLCSNLLHNWLIGPCLRERPHVLEIAGREAPHLREGMMQIGSQPIHHPGAPAMLLLARQDVSPYLPVEQHELAVDCQRRAYLGHSDPFLQVVQEIVVAFRVQSQSICHAVPVTA